MAAIYEERRPLVERLLRERPRCEARWCCDGARSVDVHEILSRGRGGSILDETNCLACCRACHDLATTNTREAQCRGLLLPSWAPTAMGDPWKVAAELRAGVGPCPWSDPFRPCPRDVCMAD